MKRIEKIYQYVKEQTKNLTPMTLTSDAGVTTQEISERLNIQRTNASKDLNQLVREGQLEKIIWSTSKICRAGGVSASTINQAS